MFKRIGELAMEEKTIIPLSIPCLKGNELSYVTEAVETEWVSSGGQYVNLFEQQIAHYVGSQGAVSCQSGTAGIHTALLTLGISSEDVVLVPTLTFIAAVNPVRYIGATPVFMDCDDSLCMDPQKLKMFCEQECYLEKDILFHKKSGKAVKAIIVVHVFGNLADMVSIMEIAKKYHLQVIEDATEALGTYVIDGKYQGVFAGMFGDIGVYSFNGNKIITTGGGGMIVSDHLSYLSEARHLTTQAKSDELYYIHDEVGYNYRMTNLQAALGVAQLEQLEHFVQIKNDNYILYRKFLDENIFLMPFRDGIRSNKWFYSILCQDQQQRDDLIEGLRNEDVQTRPIWDLIHKQKPYQKELVYQIEKANFYQERIVNIPCSTNLSKEEVMCVSEKINLLLK